MIYPFHWISNLIDWIDRKVDQVRGETVEWDQENPDATTRRMELIMQDEVDRALAENFGDGDGGGD